MNCPYCGEVMETGKVQIYEFGSVLLKLPATLKFTPDNKNIKAKKADQAYEKPEGYYCVKCNRIIASYAAQQPLF